PRGAGGPSRGASLDRRRRPLTTRGPVVARASMSPTPTPPRRRTETPAPRTAPLPELQEDPNSPTTEVNASTEATEDDEGPEGARADPPGADDEDIERSEGEGMVTEDAKVSAVDPDEYQHHHPEHQGPHP